MSTDHRGEMPPGDASEAPEATGEAPGAVEPPPEVAGVETMLQELASARERIAELQERMLRLQADFDNYRRRSRAEVERAAEDARQKAALPFFGVMDDIERALASIPDDPAWSATARGVRMIHQGLLGALSSIGIEPIPAAGEPFDPAMHEVLARVDVEDAKQDGRVLEELRRGYHVGGRVLRPSVVKVGVYRKPPGAGGRDRETPEPGMEPGAGQTQSS